MKTKKILIVDDEKSARTSLALALKSLACEIRMAESGPEAIESLHNFSCDLLITDYGMPYMDGLRLLKIIKDKYPSLPVLVISGDAPVQKLIEAGASGFLQKPFDITEIKALVQTHLFQTSCNSKNNNQEE